jgi:hypothetical protein
MATARAPSLGIVNTVAMAPSLKAVNLRTDLAAFDRERASIRRSEPTATDPVGRARSAGRRERPRFPSARGVRSGRPRQHLGRLAGSGRDGGDIHPVLGRRTRPPSGKGLAGMSKLCLEISVLIDDKVCAIRHLRALRPGARPTRAERISVPSRREFEESVR